MRRIRIHKDILLRWTIKTNGEAAPLEGRDLALYLSDQYGERAALGFETEDNVVVAMFYGKDQSRLGAYTLTLMENEGKVGESAVDDVDAFYLVARTTMETDATEDNITLETLELTGNLKLLAGGEGGGSVDPDLLFQIAPKVKPVTKRVGSKLVNGWLEITHPLLGVNGYELVLMTYAREGCGCKKSRVDGGDRPQKRGGWRLALGYVHKRNLGLVIPSTAEGKALVSRKTLENYICSHYCQYNTDEEWRRKGATLEELNYYGEAIDLFFGGDCGRRKRFGFAVRKANPEYVSSSPYAITSNGKNRWLYSNVASAFVRINDEEHGQWSIGMCIK